MKDNLPSHAQDIYKEAFGFMGLILAVPALAVVMVVYEFCAGRRGWDPWVEPRSGRPDRGSTIS